jgi:hypothetical protein
MKSNLRQQKTKILMSVNKIGKYDRINTVVKLPRGAVTHGCSITGVTRHDLDALRAPGNAL